MRKSIIVILLQLYKVSGLTGSRRAGRFTTEIIPEMSVDRLKDFDAHGLIYEVPSTYPAARRYGLNINVPAMSVNRFMLAVMRVVKTYTDEDIMNIIRAIKKTIKEYKETRRFAFGFDQEQQMYLKIIESINPNIVLEALRQNEYWFLHEMGKHDKLIILNSPTMRQIAAKALKLLDDLNIFSDYLKRTDKKLDEISRNCIGVALDLSKYSVNETAAMNYNVSSLYVSNVYHITTLAGNLQDINIETLKKLDKFKLLNKRQWDDIPEINIKDYYKILHNILMTYDRQDVVDNLLSLTTSLQMLALSSSKVPIDSIFSEAQKAADEKNLVLLLDTVETRNVAANLIKLLNRLLKYKDKKQRKIFENVEIVDYIYKINADISMYAVPAAYAQVKRRLDDSLYNLNILKAMDIYKVFREPSVSDLNSEQLPKIIEQEIPVEKLREIDKYDLIYEVPNTYPSASKFTLNSTVPAMSINHFVLAVIRLVRTYKDEDILNIISTVKKINKQYKETVKFFSVSGIDEDQKKYLKVIEDVNPSIIIEALRQNECRFLYEMSTNDKLLILDSPKVRQIFEKSLKFLDNLKVYNNTLKRTDSKLEELSMNCIGVALDLAKYSVNETAAKNFNTLFNLTSFVEDSQNISIQKLINLDKFKLLNKRNSRKRLGNDVPEVNINYYYKTLRNILMAYEHRDLMDNIICVAASQSSVTSDTSNLSIDSIIKKTQEEADEKNLVLKLDSFKNRNLAANLIKLLEILLKYKDKKRRKIFENGEIVDNLFKLNADLSKYAVSASLPQVKRRFEDSQYSLKILRDMDFYKLIHEQNVSSDYNSRPPIINAKDFCKAIINVLKSYDESDLRDVFVNTELILNRLKNSPKSKVGYVWNKLMNAVVLMKVTAHKDLKKYLDVLEKQIQDEKGNKILKLDNLEERILAKQVLKFLNDLTAYNNKMEGNIRLKNIIANGLILVSDFKALSFDAHTFSTILGMFDVQPEQNNSKKQYY